jgi:hypothetical protein
VRRKADKAFTNRVEDLHIKMQVLLGGQKMVNKALRQALELQAMFLSDKMECPTCWQCGGISHLRRNCQQGCPQECFTEETDCPKARDQGRETRKVAVASTFINLITRSACVMKTAMTVYTVKDK